MVSSSSTISTHGYPGAEDVMNRPLLSYKDYIQSLCTRNPSLQTLYAFLANPKARSDGCHATALDFRTGHSIPVARPIPHIDCLLSEIRVKDVSDFEGESPNCEHCLQGRILIIEDLTVNVMQMLGIELELDPLFLATHLHTVHRTSMRHQTPDDATLPSRLYGRNYLNVSYHQPVTSNISHPAGSRYSLDTAIDRKLVFLRATSIGLVQSRISIIKIQPRPDFWLVDPPLGHAYFRTDCKGDPEHKINLTLKPYLGTYEDFMEPLKYSEGWYQEEALPSRGVLSDLIRYWMTTPPDCFDPSDPSIQSLAYYPLKIVAAQWVKYIAVMLHCIKMYEYEGSQLDIEKFDMDLRELQGWRRRVMISRHKIKAVIRHLQSHISKDAEHRASIDRILEDYMSISDDIEDAGRRLENMLPIVTSLVQIIDARQSFAETANISRLTVLALIFVPLSYVSSLFSMNSENMPGSKGFWVYFAVAIPVTLGVILIARPPTEVRIKRTLAWMWLLLKSKVRNPRPTIDTKNVVEVRSEEWTKVRSETMRM